MFCIFRKDTPFANGETFELLDFTIHIPNFITYINTIDFYYNVSAMQMRPNLMFSFGIFKIHLQMQIENVSQVVSN